MPQEILDKPAALSSAEWRTVVQHPRIGQVILEQAAALKDAVPIILHHHERFAGHGYPYGLRANEIPLGARIVAIADAYDAMTHDRPVQAGDDRTTQAIEELRRHAGTQFDPELVTLFCDLYAAHAPAPDPTVLAMMQRHSPAHVDELVRPDTAARIGHTRRAPRPKPVPHITASTSDGSTAAMAGEGSGSVELRPVTDISRRGVQATDRSRDEGSLPPTSGPRPRGATAG